MPTTVHDGSLSAKTIVLHGGAAVDATTSVVNASSLKLSTAGDYAEVQRKESGWYFGTNDFTIEFWVNFNSGGSGGSGGGFWQSRVAGSQLLYMYLEADALKLYSCVGDWTFQGRCTWSPLNGTWYHVAVSRVSGTLRIFIDGVSKTITWGIGSGAGATPDAVNQPFRIGRREEYGLQEFDGRMDEFRISKGIGRYTADFTPATTRFVADQYTTLLLHGDSFVDSSYDNHNITVTGATIDTTAGSAKFGKGCIDFRTNGKYIDIPYRDDFLLADRDFTWECWVNHSATPGDNGYIQHYQDDSNEIHLGRFGGRLMFDVYVGSSLYSLDGGTWAPTIGTWHHVAVSRCAGIGRLFADGQLVGSPSTMSLTVPAITGSLRVGMVNTTYSLIGNIDGVRVTKGAGRYAASFTPPLIPFERLESYDLADKTKLLIRAAGANGSTTIVDDSKWSNAVTVTGDTQLSSTSGDYAVAFNSGRLEVDCNEINLDRTTSWCLEFDVMRTAALGDYSCLFSRNLPASPYTGWMVTANNNTGSYKVYLSEPYNGTAWINTTSVLALNKFHHVTFVYDKASDQVRAFFDGALEMTVNGSAMPYTTIQSQKLFVGQVNHSGVHQFVGKLANIRFVKNDTVYAVSDDITNITPTPMLVSKDGLASCKICLRMNNNVTDESPATQGTTNANVTFSTTDKVLGSHSAVFNGSNSCVYTAHSDDFDFGTGDFTVECRLKLDAVGAYYYFFGTANCSEGSAGWGLYLLTTANLRMNGMFSGGWGFDKEFATAFKAGVWYHIALVRKGTALDFYRDGAWIDSAVCSTNFTATNGLRIGLDHNNGLPFAGKFDEFKIYKGLAKYSTNFSPGGDRVRQLSFQGAESVTDGVVSGNDANTKLLLHLNSDFEDCAAGAGQVNTATPTGTPVISKSVYRISDGSLYLDGSSWVTYPVSADNYLGVSDFTIEFYTRLNANTATCFVGTGFQYGFLVFYGGSGDFRFYYKPEDGGSTAISFNWTITANTWYHVSVVRAGDMLSLFVDGVKIGDSQSITSSISSSAYGVGVAYDPSTPTRLAGYIQELSISRVARHAASFTPPVLPSISSASNVIINSIADKLVACYKFDDPQPGQDCGTSKYDLMNFGVTSGAGKLGKCAVFSGDSYLGGGLTGANRGAIVEYPDHMAVSLWVKPSAYDSSNFIISFNSAGWLDVFTLYTWSSGSNELYFSVFDSTPTQYQAHAGAAMSLNYWHHVFACVSKEAGMWLYVDGVKTSQAFTAANMSAMTYFKIGARGSDSSNGFKGSLDEVYFWSGVSKLFDTEAVMDAFAAALYNGGTGKFIAG